MEIHAVRIMLTITAVRVQEEKQQVNGQQNPMKSALSIELV